MKRRRAGRRLPPLEVGSVVEFNEPVHLADLVGSVIDLSVVGDVSRSFPFPPGLSWLAGGLFCGWEWRRDIQRWVMHFDGFAYQLPSLESLPERGVCAFRARVTA